MSDIKYRIELGNCRTGINESITKPIEDKIYRADTIVIRADNTEITADYNL